MTYQEIKRPLTAEAVLTVVASALFELGALVESQEGPREVPISDLLHCLALLAESGIEMDPALAALVAEQETEVLEDEPA